MRMGLNDCLRGCEADLEFSGANGRAHPCGQLDRSWGQFGTKTLQAANVIAQSNTCARFATSLRKACKIQYKIVSKF